MKLVCHEQTHREQVAQQISTLFFTFCPQCVIQDFQASVLQVSDSTYDEQYVFCGTDCPSEIGLLWVWPKDIKYILILCS